MLVVVQTICEPTFIKSSIWVGESHFICITQNNVDCNYHACILTWFPQFLFPGSIFSQFASIRYLGGYVEMAMKRFSIEFRKTKTGATTMVNQ